MYTYLYVNFIYQKEAIVINSSIDSISSNNSPAKGPLATCALPLLYILYAMCELLLEVVLYVAYLWTV